MEDLLLIDIPDFSVEYESNMRCGYSSKKARENLRKALERASKGYCMYCYKRIVVDGNRQGHLEHAIEKDFSFKTLLSAIALSVLCTSLLYLFIYAIFNSSRKRRLQSKNSSPSVHNGDAASSHKLQSPPSPTNCKVSIRVNDAVHHKKFGLGVIKKVDGQIFTVQFDHNEKEFTAPNIFDSGDMINFNSLNRDNKNL